MAEPRIRVLWLIKGLGPGGAENLLATAATLHDDRVFELDAAYLLPWKNHLVARLEASGVTVSCLNVRTALDPRWLLRLLRLLRRRRYHVVHLHSPLVASLARPVLRLLPSRWRPRVMSTEHNVRESYTWATRGADRATLWMDDVTLAVSETVLASMPQHARSRTRVLVQGVVLDQIRDAVEARSQTRHEMGVTDDEILVVTVANLRHTKNYPDLLRAATEVVKRHKHVRFAAVGQGPLEEGLREQHAALGLGERFQFLGYRPDGYRITAAADLFVLASDHEGYPISVMEALAAGIPVVATRVGGIPSAMHDGVEGYIVEPRQPEALADAISDLVRDTPKRLQMREAAALRGKRFDIGRAVTETEEIYAELAGRGDWTR